jgi:hypothetical protein
MYKIYTYWYYYLLSNFICINLVKNIYIASISGTFMFPRVKFKLCLHFYIKTFIFNFRQLFCLN